MARFLIRYHDMPRPEPEIAALGGVLRVEAETTDPSGSIAGLGSPHLLSASPP